jgi:hypothetical protein
MGFRKNTNDDCISIASTAYTEGGINNINININNLEQKFLKTINLYLNTIVENFDEETFSNVFKQNIPRVVKKEKDIVDIEKPKSMFLYFATDKVIREDVKKRLSRYSENPTPSEVTSEISKLWKSEKYRIYSIRGKKFDTKLGRNFDYNMEKVKKWFDLEKEDKKRYENELREKGIKFYICEDKSLICKEAIKLFRKAHRKEIRNSLKTEYSDLELKYKVDFNLDKKWESLKDRVSDSHTHKDKFGKFTYMIEAKKWIDMAEDADEEKELDKIINEDFNDDAETVKYFSLPLKSPNVVRFEFSDDENSENEDSEKDDIKQDKTFKKPRVVN